MTSAALASPPALRAHVPLDQAPRSFHLPVLLALLPPLGSLFVGTPDAWSDAVMLVLAAFYLYYLVRVPWEMYMQAHARAYPRAVNSRGLNAEQLEAVRRLQWHERGLFLLVLAAPVIGGVLLLVLQSTMRTAGSRYLTPGTILLYVLAASVRPLTHLVQRVEARAELLHTDAAYPDDAVNQLLATVDRLEAELRDVRMATTLRSDTDQLRDTLEQAVESVARAVRQYARKSDHALAAAEEHITRLEARLRGIEEWCEVQRVQAAQQSLVVRCVWEPVTVLKEAVGASGKGLLGVGV